MSPIRQNIIKTVNALTAQDWTAWEAMRAENSALISPYFHPSYIRRLNELVSDLRVVCAYEDGKNIGFLSVQGRKTTRPAGAPFSDFHGIIQAVDTQLDLIDILAGTGIDAYHFSAVISSGNIPEKYRLDYQDTAALNIGTSAQDWRESRDDSYRRHMKSTRRRIRKAEKDIGPRRFVFQSDNQDTFEQLIRWKIKKFSDTGKYNVLSADWAMALIRGLWEQASEDGLRCDMHALYFGDHLAAVDLGLSDGIVFHSWIVAYDHQFQNYAPGIQLLEGLIDAAADLGYKRIDMGAGLEGYKRHYATHGHPVTAGFIPVKGAAGAISALYGTAERWGQGPLKDMPGKLRRRYSQIAACEHSRTKRAKAMLEAILTTSKQ